MSNRTRWIAIIALGLVGLLVIFSGAFLISRQARLAASIGFQQPAINQRDFDDRSEQASDGPSERGFDRSESGRPGDFQRGGHHIAPGRRGPGGFGGGSAFIFGFFGLLRDIALIILAIFLIFRFSGSPQRWEHPAAASPPAPNGGGAKTAGEETPPTQTD